MNNTTCNCRKCNQPLRKEYQPPLREGGRDYYYLTCDNDQCQMFGYTFTTDTYDTLDLTPYLKNKAS